MAVDDDDAAVERACWRAAVAYARCTDLGDGAGAARWFTADGRLEMPGNRVYTGRDAIARRIDEQPAGQVSRHLLGPALFTRTSAITADATLPVTMYRGPRPAAGGPVALAGPYLVGEYIDTYHRDADGWRIAHRRLVTIFRRNDP